jgi:hypothetical protein
MLNFIKYVFSVSPGKPLSYIVFAQGNGVNLKKVEAIKQLQPLRTRREIQKLICMMEALSRFISKLGKHGMPFYKLLCKVDGF